VFPTEIKSFPKNEKMCPTAPEKAKVTECFKIRRKPLIAAVQKLSPVKTI
jgi:hypothetical protein